MFLFTALLLIFIYFFIDDNSWMSVQAGLGGAKLITNPETYSLVKKVGD